MFETVVPETVAPRSRRVFYETLPISLVAHALIGTAFVASTIWEIEFPQSSPAMYAPYQLTAAPPPPPPPPPPPAAARSQAVQEVQTAHMPEVAPTIIPDVIPEVLPAVETDSEGVEGGVEGGIAGGYLGGVIGGVIGGIITEDVVELEPNPPVIEIARDADLPIDIIDRRYPDYPSLALMRGWEDQLVVRYIIGKDGRVSDVQVLEPPEREQFGRATVRRIREWRFRPYRDESGQLKEVVHELTVQFRIISKRAS